MLDWEDPTPREFLYLDFIEKYVGLHGVTPREQLIAEFGVSSATVRRVLQALEKKRLLVRDADRALRPIDRYAPDPDDEPPPSRPVDEIAEPLDDEIADLVHAIRATPRCLTRGSCSGHGKRRAYIDVAVEGMAGLKRFVAMLNAVDRQIRTEALPEVTLNWSEEVVTSCFFDRFPEWISLTLTIEGPGKNGAPMPEPLSKMARLWALVSKAPAA